MKRRTRHPDVDPMLRAIFDAANAMTASGQEPRKHHVVPKFYLDRWAENGRVLVTDLDAHTSHEVDPKNALVEKDFYRVPAGTIVGNDSPVVWEAALSQIEGMVATVLSKFDRFGPGALDGPDLRVLVDFMALQIVRSRWWRYQTRWHMSVGIYRQFELDRPGAIEAWLRENHDDVSPERVAVVTAFWEKVTADPWQLRIPAAVEMDLAQRGAVGLGDLLADRRPTFYKSAKPLITSDEPVISLWEDMAADHVIDGGYNGAPIVALALDPHNVFALFRSNMPVVRLTDEPLDWRESLGLNQVIAGNAFRNTVSQPSNDIASKLRIPEAKEPTQFQTVGPTERGELVRSRMMRRWSDERDAPLRPVASWWPAVVPPPVKSPPLTKEEFEAERRLWESGAA